MADKAHSAGNPACKSSVPIIKRRDSNRGTTIDTTRRALIAGTASLTALAIPSAAHAPAPAHDAGLLRRIAAFRRAKSISDGWHKTVYDPAAEAYKAARDAVPHHTTKASFENMYGKRMHLTTESTGAGRIVRTMQRDGETYGNDDFGACCKELEEALDAREAALGQIDSDWNAAGLCEHSNALCDHTFAALGEVYAYPVRTVADLTLKLETMREVDDDPIDVDDLLADLNRIAGRA
jgi:hypothetical protein